MIFHAAGDPWDGCVVYVSGFHTSQLVRCRLPENQHPHAKAKRWIVRLLSTSDLF